MVFELQIIGKEVKRLGSKLMFFIELPFKIYYSLVDLVKDQQVVDVKFVK